MMTGIIILSVVGAVFFAFKAMDTYVAGLLDVARYGSTDRARGIRVWFCIILSGLLASVPFLLLWHAMAHVVGEVG